MKMIGVSRPLAKKTKLVIGRKYRFIMSREVEEEEEEEEAVAGR